MCTQRELGRMWPCRTQTGCVHANTRLETIGRTWRLLNDLEASCLWRQACLLCWRSSLKLIVAVPQIADIISHCSTNISSRRYSAFLCHLPRLTQVGTVKPQAENRILFLCPAIGLESSHLNIFIPFRGTAHCSNDDRLPNPYVHQGSPRPG